MIELNQVTKKFGNKKVVADLSLCVSSGECFGFLGPNGAGKTTTIRMIMALSAPNQGTIKVNGLKADRNSVNYKASIGIVPQHNNLEPELTVMENLKLHAMLYRIPNADAKQRIDEMLAFSELTDSRDVLVHQLSGGMKRKLIIARAMLHEPKVLLLDEPTVGLDVFSRQKVWDLIKSLCSKGITIFLTTHYLEEAEALCSRIALVKQGSLLMVGTMEELREKVGPVVGELFQAGKTQLEFFSSRQEALQWAAKQDEEVINIRQTRLDDVFIKLTKD